MDAREGTVVLVAEDDPHALSGYLEFLTRSGFVASGSRSGTDAYELAMETVPDILVTDIMMPGLDGFALAAALRAKPRTRHVPIVGMTGHWTAAMQNDAQRAGFAAMLLKPCLPAHLLAEVERVLRHARLLSAALGHVTVGTETVVPVGLRNAVMRRQAFQRRG
jgi:CheY-like chemotaxis protein